MKQIKLSIIIFITIFSFTPAHASFVLTIDEVDTPRSNALIWGGTSSRRRTKKRHAGLGTTALIGEPFIVSHFDNTSAIEVVEHVWLNQGVHVSGELLCSDGHSLFFKNQASCEMSNYEGDCGAEEAPVYFSSFYEKGVHGWPINRIEIVKLRKPRVRKDKELKVFYSIPLTYMVSLHEPYLSSNLSGIVEADIPGKLIDSKMVPIPYCVKDLTKVVEPKVVVSERFASKGETSVLKALVERGFRIINSPTGPLDQIEQLTKSFKEYSFENLGDTVPYLGSPECNYDFDEEDVPLLASGEWSGNGIVIKASQLASWQESSTPINLLYKGVRPLRNNITANCLSDAEEP